MRATTTIRLWRIASAVSLLGVVQFVACCGLAMARYPGGTLIEPNAEGYKFYENFLSDLGRTRAWGGEDNAASAALFNRSVQVLAVSLVPFFLLLPLHAPDRPWIMGLAAALGLFSLLALARIGQTPYDVRGTEHIFALFCWVGLLFAAAALHSMALIFSRDAPSSLGLVSLTLAIIVAAYLFWGLAASPFLGGATAPHSAPVKWQKSLVAACLAWYLIFSLWMLFRVRRAKAESASPAATLDEDALAYMKRLGR